MTQFNIVVIAARLLLLLTGTACSIHERNLQYDILAEGEACRGSSGECGPGLGCVGAVCRRYCRVDTDCDKVDDVQKCEQTLREDGSEIEGVKTCSRVCDPVSPQTPISPLTACPSGIGCTSSSDGASDCILAGTAEKGMYCDSWQDCAPGNYCSEGDTCNRYCYVDADCPAGSTCGQFLTPPRAGARVVGGCTTTLLDSLNQEYVQLCKKLNECAPGRLVGNYETVATCAERTRLYTTWLAKLPHTNLTAKLLSSCTAAWRNLACDSLFKFDPDECRIAGTLPDGSPCNAPEQCQSLNCYQHGWSCGICAPTVDAGASCEAANCGRGLWCMPDDTCQRPRNENETCSETLLCRDGLSCYRGACTVRPKTAGATCDAANGLGCADEHNLYCHSGTNRCIPVEWADIGESCSTTSSKATWCSGMNTCSGATCVEGPADGGTCGTGQSCQWPAYCSEQGRCVLPTAAPACSTSGP